MKKMQMLLQCLKNDIRGLSFFEMEDFEGYELRGDKWTEYTIYCAEEGFSSYVAIPDCMKGIDIADEKPLSIKESLFAAVSAIKSEQIRRGFDGYDKYIPINSMPVIVGGWEGHRT